LNANHTRLAPTGYPAHKSVRGIRFTLQNGPQLVDVLVTYAALDELEVPAEGGGDHYARFAKHRDRFEKVANHKYIRGAVEPDGSIELLPGDL